ncbi:MAG: hypothetical protein FD160_2441 [Caulobacteraceae bacterium]|nr:MAG: hypothetical protein FD160_2441 [Caulobacteraceae bacterium]
MTMAMVFILPVAAILCVALLRRALPVGAAALSAAIAWLVTRDLSTTCVAGAIVLCVTAAFLDLGATSTSSALRRLSVGAEGLATAARLSLLAFALLQTTMSGVALMFSVACAGLIGFGIVLRWREHAR